MEVRSGCSTATPHHTKHGPTMNKLPHIHPQVLKVSVQTAYGFAVLNSHYSPESLIRAAKNNPPGRNRTHRGYYRRCDIDAANATTF